MTTVKDVTDPVVYQLIRTLGTLVFTCAWVFIILAARQLWREAQQSAEPATRTFRLQRTAKIIAFPTPSPAKARQR